MEWLEGEVRDIERTTARRPPANGQAAFYGSSSIRLWDDLAADLGSSRVVNRGFGGSTLEACGYFFERVIPPLKPCSLVVYAGDNDLGDGKRPSDVLASFLALMDKVNRYLSGVPFAFISIKPSPARRDILEH